LHKRLQCGAASPASINATRKGLFTTFAGDNVIPLT
jgi:hypothetical protein